MGIDNYAPRTGRTICEDGSVANIADLLKEISGKLAGGTQAIVDNITLIPSGWSSGQYVIANTNIKATSVIYFAPAKTITGAEYDAVAAAKLIEANMVAGSLTIQALGTVPVISVPIAMIIM